MLVLIFIGNSKNTPSSSTLLHAFKCMDIRNATMINYNSQCSTVTERKKQMSSVKYTNMEKGNILRKTFITTLKMVVFRHDARNIQN